MNYSDFNSVTVKSIFGAQRRKCRLGWIKEEPKRPCCSFTYIIKGNAEFSYPGKESIFAGEGDIVWFKYDDIHITKAMGKTPLEYICVSFLLASKKSAGLLPFKPVMNVGLRSRYLEIFEKIEDACYQKYTAYNIYAKSMVQILIYNLLCDIANEYSDKKGRMNAVIEYIEEFSDKNITIESLSEMSGYSPSHFRKRFGEIYGMSPVEYINRVRVRKAKNMLESNLYSIADVAAKCGFSNVYYFSRVFKKITGIPPSKF